MIKYMHLSIHAVRDYLYTWLVATDLEGISQIYHELSLYRENKKTAKKHLTKAVVRSLAANP